MMRINKIRAIFSIYFWKQVYLLITSFLTGNVWAKSRLGSYENIDINTIYKKYREAVCYFY
mgnify:CR=1 FL=1